MIAGSQQRRCNMNLKNTKNPKILKIVNSETLNPTTLQL
jgi:hypothetical protein